MRDEADYFDWLVMRHIDAAYNLARSLLRNDADAQDAVQESMIMAYRSLGNIRGNDAKPWLLQVVRNACFRQLERRKKAPTSLQDEPPASLCDDADPEQEMLLSAQADEVRKAIDTLPEEFREVLVLREFEEMSYADMSTVIGVPPGTIMSRLSRARAMLAGLLRRRCAEEAL